jgi:hypothetical protein
MAQERTQLRPWWAGAGRAAWMVLLCGAAACSRTPPVTVQVQGTVRVVGTKRPIAGAEVNIEWPAVLGGGQTLVKTDGTGRFAVGRTRRQPPATCAGLALTVQAPGYASAYLRHESGCGNYVLNFDFVLLPQPR